ncbi:uncharacterized protein DUF4303 [Roseimicrobium gellanilyticum]|uniref:Uncharacterized protein DUF4303 n=1 Tax=Roseimicrobium gellanilyticum TaxID=748857 RepID=A0A366HSF2_9BACT|nr:DUF4303 domain-containing protein [Roseimicrobium gellanilyticum]RBP46602.1 uncharacterized protein DUF4303 [Roseimicrobium gellanilyticum]
MDTHTLQRWLSEPRTELIQAVAEGIRIQVETLRARNIDFYGYALLPGEPYQIDSIVAVANTEADIKAPRTDRLHRYYRFGVDEWAHWDYDGFVAANALLVEANEHFKSMHRRAEDNCVMDDYEVAHSDALLDALVQGLESARAGGVFGGSEPFLLVWISDSGHEIMMKSARRLNSATVAQEFIAEFG